MSFHRWIPAGLAFGALVPPGGHVGGPAPAAPSAAVVEVRVTAADGRILVEEALARGGDKTVVLSLEPGASAFQVQGSRVVLLASAQSGPLTCPVRISGVPTIQANRLALSAPDIATSGMLCEGALELLREKSLAALTSHPWDLARRLASASINPALPGPRLPVAGCVLAEQMSLRSVRPQAAVLTVAVEVAPRAPGVGCA